MVKYTYLEYVIINYYKLLHDQVTKFLRVYDSFVTYLKDIDKNPVSRSKLLDDLYKLFFSARRIIFLYRDYKLANLQYQIPESEYTNLSQLSDMVVDDMIILLEYCLEDFSSL